MVTSAMLLLSIETGQAANLYGDSIIGSVRAVGDPVGTNYFASSPVTVGNPDEFIGTAGDFEILADVDFGNQIFVKVTLTPPNPDSAPPQYRFAFSDLDFNPASTIVGVELGLGTPGVGISEVAFGPSWLEFTLGTTFLGSGGSMGVSVQIQTVPEPPSVMLAAAACVGLLAVSARPVRSRHRAGSR